MREEINRDLYEILSVDRSATKEEIKHAYRKRAREIHPDVAPDDPEAENKFKELSFAYEILSDDKKRRDYDMYGLDGLRRDTGLDFSGFTSFHDLIDMFFGGGFRDPFVSRTRTNVGVRGRDIEDEVEVALSEVLTGTEKEIEVSRYSICRECDGTGMMPGTHLSKCSVCGGTGQVSSRRESFFGTIISSSTCAECKGTGRVITEKCSRCGGEGRIRVNEKLRVSIPPGVETGDRLLINGKGDDGLNGGRSGNLYVTVMVREEPAFRRAERDLFTDIDVSMVDAALGTEIDIQTLNGNKKLKIPAGTQPSEVIRVKGEGVPRRGGGRRGDILVSVNVVVPKKLSGEERKILEKFRKLRG
ncbi:MAG: molecular chaperone DnaJ [Actinomycetota bacterium]|nr:molecular chaperone DnaJ [Actinomycetota bacterium]